MFSNLISNMLKYFVQMALLYSFLMPTVLAKNKYNVTMQEMDTCKEYDLRGTGYKYADFFLVHSLDNNKLTSEELLHLKFYVLTSMDAHILLSVTDKPRTADRVYEIVIGAGGNTFSAIRTSMGRRRVATNQDEYILSVFDPTPIEIVQMKDGNLLVYIPGFKQEPLLNFTDASPLHINYVSFSTFGSISARWYFDCQFDGFGTEIEQEQRPLTPRQRLIANITEKAEKAALPAELNVVSFTLQIRAVSYQQEISILKTRLNLILAWQDTKLQWKPEDFDGIDTIVEPDLDIWTPTLVVINGAYKSIGHIKLAQELRVHSNGSVLLMARDTVFTTWCLNHNRDWPHEVIQCEIAMGLTEVATLANVGQLQLNYTMLRPLTQDDDFTTYSEWAFERISVANFLTGTLARYTPKGLLRHMDGDVSISFTISRNSSFYKNVFTMPVLTAHSLILISFLLRGYRRGALLLVVFVVLALGIMFLTRHAPVAYVPNIMYFYQFNMCCAVYCYLLHIVLVWLELFPPKNKPSSCVMSLVNSSPLRLLLCMRLGDSTDFVDIQEHPWRQIAKMLNSLNLLVVLCCLMVINVILLPKA